MKYIKLCFFSLFFIFLCSYFSFGNGYYEYYLANQRNLTKKEIEHFENDVREGKSIDVNSYVNENRIDYSTPLTKKTSEVSLKFNEYLKKFIGNVFKVLEKFVKQLTVICII